MGGEQWGYTTDLQCFGDQRGHTETLAVDTWATESVTAITHDSCVMSGNQLRNYNICMKGRALELEVPSNPSHSMNLRYLQKGRSQYLREWILTLGLLDNMC